jgi:hypothetical protein
MSRGNLLTVAVLALALAGMFFWTLNLEQRLGGGGASQASAPGRGGDLEQRLQDLETRVYSLDELTRGNQVEIEQMRTGFAKLSESNDAHGRLLATLSGRASEAGAPATVADAGLKAQVEAILKEREEKAQADRNERMARGWSRYLLSEIDATDDQKDQFVKVVASYMDGRGKVFRKYADSGRGTDNTERDAELKALEQDRNQKLQGIFGASDYAKIEERLNRSGRRFGDGGRGSPRRAR